MGQKSAFAIAIGGMLLFSGCKDNLVITEPQDPNDIEIEGDCLGFVMELDRYPNSRSDNASQGISFSTMGTADILKYDDYIDTQDKFRIFFFTESGDFLFGATDRVVGRLQNTTSTNYWYIRIPMTMIVDRDNQEYDIDKIKNYLKTNKFKIAVLANWPNAGEKVNPADWDDAEGSQSANENPSSTLKGHPLWNWSNSILNEEANPNDIRNINDLHHVYNDIYYADPHSTSTSRSRLSVFQDYMAHVTSEDEPGYYMGEPTDWVKMREVMGEGGWKSPDGKKMVDVNSNGGFTSKEEANRWIRANWTPLVDLNQNKKIYRHYQHMWFLWNFDATFKYGAWLEKQTTPVETDKKKMADKYYGHNWGWNNGSTLNPTNGFGIEWYDRNGNELYDWMEPSYNEGKTPIAIGSKTIDIGESNNGVRFNYTRMTGSPAYCVKVGENYGIQLPALGAGPKGNSNGMMNFQARTTGTLRIKWGSADGNPATLAVQIGLQGQTSSRDEDIVYRTHRTSSMEPVDWINAADGNLNFYDISVNAGSYPVFIYSTEGKAVVYSIEYIRGKYLYETDREGVAPNENQGIPMYGVKDFEPIPDWQRGTTHNLDGNINLIRALAKVEVFIKADFGAPKHVLMRGMNRAARCEPMDVHSPTEQIWNDNHYSSSSDLCEWFRIQNHGANYTIPDYSKWLGWFYGSWKEQDCKWKVDGSSNPYRWDYNKRYYVPNGTQGGWNKGNFKSEADDNGNKPPHIFNPYLYRCDFCQFLYVEETTPSAEDMSSNIPSERYYHYVLYVPEKNIDDPTSVGNTNSTPRVAHIEYRFAPSENPNSDGIAGVADDYSNTEYNLDDNDCFRIYFTNYGTSNNSTLANTEANNEIRNWNRSTYDSYEKSYERLNKHWPIMRNHIYKFYVGGDGPENPEIHVQVSDWSHRKVVLEW